MPVISDTKRQTTEDAFKDLYERSFERLYGYVYARTGDAGITEELLQETYAAAWVSLGSFRCKSQDTTWITAIARHKIADFYRQTIRKEQHEEPCQGDVHADEDLEAIIIKQETKDFVEKALHELNPAYRCVLVMKYLDGYRLKEIASFFHKTPKAVDGMLQRAKSVFLRNYQRSSRENCHE